MRIFCLSLVVFSALIIFVSGVYAESDSMARLKAEVRAEVDQKLIEENTMEQQERNQRIRDLENRDELLRDKQREMEKKIIEFKEKVKENNRVRIRDKEIILNESERYTELKAGMINARTGLNLTFEDFENQTLLRAILSNGRYAELRFMPDTASEIALERLNAKCDSDRNCSIEIKEVGKRNESKVVYEVKIQKESKFLFMFKNNMEVRTQVDAESGEVIDVKKPWWSFMAKESE